MKFKKVFLTLILLLFLFPIAAYAAETDGEELYSEQYYDSGADKLTDFLPDSTREYFEKNGIDPSDYGWVGSLTSQNVFSHILEFLKSGAKTPLKSGAAITAVILIAAAFSSAEIKSSAVQTAIYAAVTAAAAIIAGPVYASIKAGVDAMKGLSVFMLGFIPVFAVIVAASGGAATSVSMSALLLTAAQGVSYISSFAVLPLMGGYLAVSISSSVSPLMQRSGIAETVKKLALWITAFISTVFAGILDIQTAVNSSADTLTAKTARFIIGSSVPVAGGVLSEALGTVTASVTLLKSSVGIYGAAACAAILLPLITELLLWRAVLLITAGVAGLFSLPQISGLLKAVDSMMSVLLGIILMVGAMFVISLAVVVSTGRAR